MERVVVNMISKIWKKLRQIWNKESVVFREEICFVYSNPSLELLRERVHEANHIRDRKSQALSGVMRFITELAEVQVHPHRNSSHIKFRECCTIEPDSVTIKEVRYDLLGRKFETGPTLKFETFYNASLDQGVIYYDGFRIEENEVIDRIISWLLFRNVKIPEIKGNES